MCGIFGYLSEKEKEQVTLEDQFMNGKHRGPEFSKIKTFSLLNNKKLMFGFHRLAINGLDEKSNQPLELNGCSLICNGEIYNYKDIYKKLNITPQTNSDCEAILHLYTRYGIETTLHLIDGVYAFIIYDAVKAKLIVARDAYGVRPLFSLKTVSGEIGFASEMKQLIQLRSSCEDKLEQFKPASYSTYYLDHRKPDKINVTYSTFPFVEKIEHPVPSEYTIYRYMAVVNTRLRNAVAKRVDTTDRHIACLLSGGLDSSLITALVASCVNDVSNLETYSIGLPGSVDLEYAEKVAMYLGTKHTTITVSPEDFLAAIPEVINAIESYDTTTVRASVGNYLVAKYISENSDAKVIFNGDGSDELTGGYLYFHNSPDDYAFDKECKRLLKNIHFYDVLRSDRCISYHGLEARTPFLDRAFVEYYLTIPKDLRNHCKDKQCEKFFLRKAFACDKILPEEVLWRTKEAFSDGVSSQEKSWYQMIQENIPENLELDNEWFKNLVNPPKTPEQKYYRTIFENFFPGMGSTIPRFWMPKFVNSVDASARSLDIYDALVKK